MPTALASLHNRRIKALARLTKRRERDSRRLTVVEGLREIDRALKSGIIPTEAFICPAMIQDAQAEWVTERLYQLDRDRLTHLFEITPEIFARVAYRSDSGGLLMVIPYLETRLDQLVNQKPTFLAVIEGVEKPGNLGAILRSADGAGVDGIIACTGAGQEATDIHNPNVIRASLGTLFNVPVAESTSSAALHWLRQQGVAIVATSPDAQMPYTAIDLKGPVAVVFGSEAHGLSELWIEASDQRVLIPMAGIADSLNLSTSTALLLYEVVRQRAEGHQLSD